MSRHPLNFCDVFDSHFELVWRSLRRLGVPESDAPEQTQRVFLAAHAELTELGTELRWNTWLFGLCVRTARDYRRETQPRGERTVVSQQQRVAEMVVNKLPENQRVVFVLYELEELPVSTIAELLDISAGTVRSRLRLARECFGREARTQSGSVLEHSARVLEEQRAVVGQPDAPRRALQQANAELVLESGDALADA